MNPKKKIVVLTGAGISQESGISTFRDMGGTWEQHRLEDVASPDGFRRNPQLVLDFYNARRRQLKSVVPNAAHFALKRLEEKYEVHIITQNVDDLHERAGSSHILHLHGELKKVRSVKNSLLSTEISEDIHVGDLASDGAQLRPDIVWFGESVPKMEEAYEITKTADIFWVVGTSLVVYPAASLLDFAPPNIPIYIIDPIKPPVMRRKNLYFIEKKASEGVEECADLLMKES